MRILWITNIPSPYRVDFFNLLGERCDLTVLFEKTNASDRNENWVSTSFKNFKGIIMRSISTGSDSAFCPGIVSWLRKGIYDVILVSNFSTLTGMLAIQLLKTKKIPFIIEADGGFAKYGRGLKERLKRYLIGAASYWFSSGGKTTDYLIQYGANKEKIFRYPFTSINQYHIISNVINNEEKIRLRRERGITGKHVAVAVGQLIHRKGFDVLIKAWAQMDIGYTLLIIGDGELATEYSEQINRLALRNVKLIGFMRREELLEYYKAADVFILPTREDIWGLVINEAMACGLPVITTDKCIAGLELVEENINGFIVNADDMGKLFEKINYLLSNDDLLSYMAANSLEKIKEYTLEKMTAKHLEYFKIILEERLLEKD